MLIDNGIWIGNTESGEKVSILPKMANRHGLIAGATGTGKTVTLKVLAESFSDMGIPVFVADVKGDVAGLAMPGQDSEDMQARIQRFGLAEAGFALQGYPVTLWDIYGKRGIPVRTTISEMGPLLLSRILELNELQSDILSVIFKIADDNQLLLVDIKDLKALLAYVDNNKDVFADEYGKMSSASIGVITRALVTLEAAGGNAFFGETALNVSDWFTAGADGKGMIHVLDSAVLSGNAPTTAESIAPAPVEAAPAPEVISSSPLTSSPLTAVPGTAAEAAAQEIAPADATPAMAEAAPAPGAVPAAAPAAAAPAGDGTSTAAFTPGTLKVSGGKLYSTFLLWFLSELYERMPEVGDLEKPKVVFFFDEAHLLFNDIPKALLEKIEQVVRLSRSKGIGIYFCTQHPKDIPDSILAQLNNKIEHGLRAYTPSEQKNVRAAADSFRENPALDTYETILNLGTGEAVVSFLQEDGSPGVVQKVAILPPRCSFGALPDATRDQMIKGSMLYTKYAQSYDPDSAYEFLQRRGVAEAEEAAAAKEAEKAAKEEEKARAKAEKEALKLAEKEERDRERAIRNVGSSVAGSVGREIGRNIGGKVLGGSSTAKRIAGNTGSSLARGIFQTFFNN